MCTRVVCHAPVFHRYCALDHAPSGFAPGPPGPGQVDRKAARRGERWISVCRTPRPVISALCRSLVSCDVITGLGS
ncbi:hypothetical protein LI90_1759 [Carbonactinospora thermoautotrophica]|uniref:Uncharacterized protein n=1 Tax=Carbonactinospora thermoautotrophica TaxID=1469144 RepID=A0A132MSL3_9ACTN|nr:hypothetical protein LI90_1759 [Carbonactinospora thermoautotrophica]